MANDINGQVPSLTLDSGSVLAGHEPEIDNSGDEMHEHHNPTINTVQEKQSPPVGYKQPPPTNGHDHVVSHEILNVTPPEVQHVEVTTLTTEELRSRPSTGLSEDEGSKRAVEKDSEERVLMSSKSGRFLKYDSEVGRGSFKTVYKGVDTETGVPVAWCELLENKYNKTEQARFKEEVSILKTLQHPNILRLYDYWEYSRQLDKKRILVLITELMTSGTLKGYMRRLKSIKPRLIRTWGRQILKGLHFLHTRAPPIIHRDLKCDNIFINGTTGLVKIGDLGLATLKRSDVTTVIGTPEFMAPEMYEENYDESVDVYAFGMCLLEMYTQEYPYMECSNPAQIYKKVSQGIRPVAMSKVNSPVLKEIIDKCVVPEKSKRFVVKQLLDHEFFAEGETKVDLVKVETIKDSTQLVFKMEAPQRVSKNGQDIVQFIYNMDEDMPDSVVNEMVKTHMLRPEEQRHVVRSIREHVESVMMKRKQHQQTGKESIGKENIPTSSTKEHSVGEDKEKERGKDVQKQSLSHVTVLVPATTTTPIPSVSEGHTMEELPLTTPPFTTPPVTVASFPSKIQRQTSGTETREQPEGQLAPSLASDEVAESRSASTFVSKVTPESVSSVLPPRPTVAEVPTSEEPDAQPKLSLQSSGMPKDTGVDASVKGKLFKVEKVEPPVLDEGPIAKSLESAGSSASVLPTLTLADSQGDLGHDHPQGNGSTRKKSGRPKEPKTKTLRLKHTYLSKDMVLGCSLNTSVGQVVNFKFSIDYDKPKEIFSNFVRAKHLAPSEEEEFICQASRIIEMVKRGEIVPMDVRSTGTEGKSLIAKTQKQPTVSQPPVTVEGLTVMSSSKLDPQEPKQQAQRETAVQKQQPSPEVTVSKAQLGEKKETASSTSAAELQDDNSPGSRKIVVIGEEKIPTGSHVENQGLVTSQTEERHPAVAPQATSKTNTATSPVTTPDHAVNTEDSVLVHHQSVDLPSQVTAPVATTTVQSNATDVLTTAITTPVMTTEASTVVAPSSGLATTFHPLTAPSSVPTSSANVTETAKKFEIEDVEDSPTGSAHGGSLSGESSSDLTQTDDNRSVVGGDWRPDDGHTVLESVSSTSMGHGLGEHFPPIHPQMTFPEHPEPSLVPRILLPHGSISTGPYPAPTGPYPAPTGSYQAPTGLYQVPTDPYPPGSSACDYNQLMQGFLKFLQYMNHMMEDPAIQQLLHYSTSSSVADSSKQFSPPDQKGPPHSAEYIGEMGSDRDFGSQSDYESDPEYRKLITRYQEEALKEAKAKALKDFRSGRTHRVAKTVGAPTGPMQPVSAGPALVGHPATISTVCSENAHIRGPHQHDSTPLHSIAGGHSSSSTSSQYTPYYYLVAPPHILPASHTQPPVPLAMQGPLHSGSRRDVSSEMDHTVSHGR